MKLDTKTMIWLSIGALVLFGIYAYHYHSRTRANGTASGTPSAKNKGPLASKSFAAGEPSYQSDPSVLSPGGGWNPNLAV